MSERLDIRLFPSAEDVPEAFRIQEPLEQTEYLIDGKIHHWSGERQAVASPVCLRSGAEAAQAHLGSYPMLGEAEAFAALEAAERAYDKGRGLWPTMSVAERIAHVEAFTRRMIARRDEVVRLLMWEIGKPLEDSQKEFDRTVAYIRDTIDALKELDRSASRLEVSEGVFAQIRRAPLGVVLCMGPFNYPLNETFTLLIPALIMGNTVIFKPPKFGVLLHRPLLEAFAESFPPGVVGTLYGSGRTIAGPLMESGRVDVLALIGTSKAASALKHQHPKPHRLRSVLGLEAKNAAIVFSDADLNHTVAECVTGALSFNGQRCTALKMFFIHENIIGSFLEKFVEKIEQLPLGMPWEAGAKITPLPESGKTAYLQELIDDALAKGAKIVNPSGGRTLHTLMAPTVLYPVDAGMRVYHEEQFGPVIPVRAFSDAEEPLRYIDQSDYGQQVSLFSSSADTVARLVDPLVNQVSRVNINSQCQRGPDTFPFTGRKDSAEGTLSVSDALRAFSIRSLAAVKDTPENRTLLQAVLNHRHSKFLSTDFIL